MFLPTSMSAMSMDRFQKPYRHPDPLSTNWRWSPDFPELARGFRPIRWKETIPSPTRARMVSSPAPPTSWWMLARTVTRAFAINWIPFLATAATGGVSITFG